MEARSVEASTLSQVSRVRQRHWWDGVIRSRNLMFGLGILATLLLVAVFAPYLTPYDPYSHDYSNTLQPPSLEHPFGTDNFGRDVLTRVLYGTRIDLRVGLIAVISPFIIGVVLGALAGYYGGVADTLVMRAVDVVQAFPSIILIIAVIAILGTGLQNMYIAVAVVAWVIYARLVRGEILVEKNREYIEAAKALGNNDRNVIWKHLLPNVISSSIVFAMADISLYILLAAALSFLGLGARPPTPEWGAMITEGQSFLTTAWWMSSLPGIAIVITGLAFSLIGDGLSDVLRPGDR